MSRNAFRNPRYAGSGGGAGPTYALATADTFNRADSAVTLGSTNGAGTLDPRAWTALGGSTWGVSSNAAYCPGPNGYATVDLANADVDISVVMSTLASQCGLMFRCSATNNHWRWISDFGTMQLAKIVAGSLTNVGTFHAVADGDTIRVATNGNAITCYRNGVIQETTTDAFNNTVTSHGLFATNAAARFDNWSGAVKV